MTSPKGRFAGVYCKGGKTRLLFESESDKSGYLREIQFPLPTRPRLSTASRWVSGLATKDRLDSVSVWEEGKKAFLFASISNGRTRKVRFSFVKSGKWTPSIAVSGLTARAVFLPGVYLDGKRVAFAGDGSVKIFTSSSLKVWKPSSKNPLPSRRGYFDSKHIAVVGAHKNERGLEVWYEAADSKGNLSLGCALLDWQDSRRVIERSAKAEIFAPNGWKQKDATCLGVRYIGRKKISFWRGPEGQFAAAEIKADILHPHPKLKLTRHPKNPILRPNQANAWETKATFNPAAILINNKVHLLYRAIGDTDVSVLGYAESEDGIHFVRHNNPAYIPRENFEGVKVKGTKIHLPGPYESGGGGCGGCEDPRLTRVEDVLYLTYVAYNGWSAPRVAMANISVEDFLAHRWDRWSSPKLISRPGVVNKNACVFPEKIKGQYVMFHRIFPNMLIDFMNDLEFKDGRWLEAKAVIRPNKEGWDTRKIGVGAPPIKTDAGWLMIYQGMGGVDGTSSEYKIGAMLLDLNDPSRVIARSAHPVLEPETDYENSGTKWGVVYPCGAIVKDGRLLVYYGGSDDVTAVAEADLAQFLEELQKIGGEPHLSISSS
jgi:predicted GH43/DUF377 family glycosyl hydrolase